MIDPGAPLAQTQQWLQRKRWECVFQSYSFFFKSSLNCYNMINATEKTYPTSQKHPLLVEYSWEELWFPGKDNIEIAFMYSQCGEDWKQVGIKQINVNEVFFNFLFSPNIQISNNPWTAGGELNKWTSEAKGASLLHKPGQVQEVRWVRLQSHLWQLTFLISCDVIFIAVRWTTCVLDSRLSIWDGPLLHLSVCPNFISKLQLRSPYNVRPLA